MKQQVRQIVSKAGAVTLALCMACSGITPFSGFSGIGKTVTAEAAGDYGLISNMQDASILHCFNWSYKAIEENRS